MQSNLRTIRSLINQIIEGALIVDAAGSQNDFERLIHYRTRQAVPYANGSAPVARLQPLLIDELGYLTLKPEQSNAFFRLMDQRYGRVSSIITSNLPTEQWYGLFDRKPLVDALLDRLQHHCITIRIDGPSLRTAPPEAVTNTASPTKPTPRPVPRKRSARR